MPRPFIAAGESSLGGRDDRYAEAIHWGQQFPARGPEWQLCNGLRGQELVAV